MKDRNIASLRPAGASMSALAAGLALWIAPGVATAQDAAPQAEQSSGGIADIVVTAQKKEESLQDIPVAVTALGRNALENMQVQNFNNLSGIAPNVIAVNSASGSNPQITIRGIVGGNVEPGRDNGVALYIDGVYISRSTGAQFDVADLDRVEVLRGPQGTLYGRNATGGAINYITAAPKGELYIRQDGTFGNYGQLRTKTRVDLPSFGDFSVSLSFMHDERDGFVRNTEAGRKWDFSGLPGGLVTGTRTSADTLGARNTEAGRVAVRYAPESLPLVVDYRFDRSRARYTNGAQQVLFDPGAYPLALGQISPVRNNTPSLERQDAIPMGFTTPERLSTFGHNLTVTLDLSDSVQFKSITGYRGFTDSYSSDVAGGGFEDVVNPNNPTQSFFLPVGIVAYERDRSFSQEAQISYKSDLIDAIGGVYYFKQHTRTLNPSVNFGYALPTLTPSIIADADNRNQSFAVFGQATLHATDQIDITGGVRSTWDKRKSKTTVTVPASDFSENFSHIDWTANVTYRPTQDLTLYAKAGSGYLTGGIFNGRAFDPEELLQYEVGAKVDLFNRRLRLNAAAFRSDYNDLQQSTLNPANFLFQTFNVGKARITGFELEATAQPVDALTLTANYGYSKFKYREFVLPAEGDVTNIASPDFYRPKHTLSLGADLTLPEFGNGVKPSINVSGRWRSDMALYVMPSSFYFAASGVDSSALDDFTRNNSVWNIDARATLANITAGPGSLVGKFSVWVKNALDKKTIANATSIPGVMIAGQFMDRRTYGLDFSVEF